MKRIILHSIMLGVALATPLTPITASADDATAAALNRDSRTGQEDFTGTLSAVNEKEKTLTVKNLFLQKSFHLADQNVLIAGDNKSAKLDDFRVGQRVSVSYDNKDGVLIARRVERPNQIVTGYVNTIDPKKRTVKIGSGAFTKTFALASDCKLVTLRGESDPFDELKVGYRVTVIYETMNGSPLTHRIEQKDSTFAGTINAVDLSAGTVRVKSLLSSKRFSLADGCQVVVNGKRESSLASLRIGQPVTISYREVEGVNVAYRLGQDTGGGPRPEGDTTTAQKDD